MSGLRARSPARSGAFGLIPRGDGASAARQPRAVRPASPPGPSGDLPSAPPGTDHGGTGPGESPMTGYVLNCFCSLGRFPALDAAAQQRFNEVMVGGQNRGIGHPGVVWEAPLRASVTMGCVAADGDEAFDSVKSMIMRRANNVALVAVEDVEQIEVTRLVDW
jgi:hypothetical protein